ncbi:MAG: hypothetical protein AAB897_03615 [Patescibacteria group bacterium]
MVDIKKLITGFLILAAVASSSALFLSSIIPSKNVALQSEPLIEESSNNSLPPLLSQNAFVESLPASKPATTPTPSAYASSDGLPPVIPTDNLTENLAQQLTRGIFASNPNGPGEVGGEAAFLLPSGEELDSMLGQSLAANNQIGALPDFNNPISDVNLKIISNASQKDAEKYFEAVDKALGLTLFNQNFDSLLAQEPSLNAAASARLVYDEAVIKLENASVPKELVSFHKSLLALVSNQKKFTEILTSHLDDPARAIALARTAQGKIDDVAARDVENYRKEFEKLGTISFSGKNSLSIFQDSFGIKTAHAFIFVPINRALTTDPIAIAEKVSTWGNWIHNLYTWVQDYLLGILQNQLISLIQRQLINWIQGGGNPKFITDWKSFLGDIFNQAAGAAIDELTDGALCSAFGPFIRLNLRNTFSGGGSLNITSCTLDRIVGNLRGFFQDFSSGGWLAYGAMLQPENDFYGKYAIASEFALRKAEDAKEAAKNTGLAGSGFLGTQSCSDGSEAHQGRCADGSTPQTRTPGETVASALSDSLSLPGQRIVNSKRLENLIAALVDAAINRIIQSGLAGLSGFSFSGSGPSPGALPTIPTEQQGTQPSGSTPATGNAGGWTGGGSSGGGAVCGNGSCETGETIISCPADCGGGEGGGGGLACTPSTQNVAAGSPAALTAQNGTGNYSWGAPGGSPSNGTGPSFSVTYLFTGLKTVLLGDGVSSVSCQVTVQ